MPGLEELLAMQGAPQGGAPMPPAQGQDVGGMAGALQAKLAELMQDPVALRGMRDFMQQQGGGMGVPGSAQAQPPAGPMQMTQGIPPGGAEAPPGAPMEMPPGAEQDMVSDEIDRKGSTWDGVDAPTQNDIERLKEDPSQTNIDSFNEQFGEGAAEQYVEVEGGSEEGGDNPSDEASEKY